MIWSDPYPDCWPIVVSESYINIFLTYPPWTNVAPEESMQRRLFFLRMAYFQVPILLVSLEYCILSLYPKCWHLVVSKACIKKSLIFALTTHVFFSYEKNVGQSNQPTPWSTCKQTHGVMPWNRTNCRVHGHLGCVNTYTLVGRGLAVSNQKKTCDQGDYTTLFSWCLVQSHYGNSYKPIIEGYFTSIDWEKYVKNMSYRHAYYILLHW